MNQIQQIATAEQQMVRALQLATDRVNQIGTDKVERAKADLASACHQAKDRLRSHMAEVALLLADVAMAFGDLSVEIVADVSASITVTADEPTLTAIPAPAPAQATPTTEPGDCPDCGPLGQPQQITPTARRCAACSRQWSYTPADVAVGDDDEGTVDLGWDGTTPHPDHAPEEPGQVVAPVNRIKDHTPHHQANGRKGQRRKR